MVQHAKFQVALLILLALSLCSSGCYVTAHQHESYISAAARYFPYKDPVPAPANRSVTDPCFYGYQATCWQPWPSGWRGCPPCVIGNGAKLNVGGEAQPQPADPTGGLPPNLPDMPGAAAGAVPPDPQDLPARPQPSDEPASQPPYLPVEPKPYLPPELQPGLPSIPGPPQSPRSPAVEPEVPETPNVPVPEPPAPETPKVSVPEPPAPPEPETPKVSVPEPPEPGTPKTFVLEPADPEAPKASIPEPTEPETPKTFVLEPTKPETPKTLVPKPPVPETPKALVPKPTVPETPKALVPEPETPKRLVPQPVEPAEPQAARTLKPRVVVLTPPRRATEAGGQPKRQRPRSVLRFGLSATSKTASSQSDGSATENGNPVRKVSGVEASQSK